MTIGFILNGEDVVIRSDANIRLIDLLRVNFGLLGARDRCLGGKCGFCAVIFNGRVSHSCLIPAFRVRGSEIITIEGYSQTDEYKDIVTGFAQAKLEGCGFCETSKILHASALLDRNRRPSRNEILKAFSGVKCRCTEPEKRLEGIENVIEVMQRRLYGRSA
jgi:carbon-monoxide dehydrogenase small subunit